MLWVNSSAPLELRTGATEDEVQAVITAVYRQVLGNPHLMASERLTEAESKLRNGDITVRGFVSAVGKSDLYRKLFFESASQYRFVEVNCKHFLGRAPLDQAELSEHVQRYSAEGYSADIDSYVDSDEYQAKFGENTVPFATGTSTQAGSPNVNFNRSFALMRGDATSDASNSASLISDIAGNKSSTIKKPAGGSGAYANTGKRFRIQVSKAGAGPRYKRSNLSCEVTYDQMTNRIQAIQRAGGSIVSITEVA